MAAPFLRFPFPLKIGTDICQISRVYNILQSKSGARFVRRILAPEEQARPRWIEPVAWILGPEDARQAVAGEQRDQRLAVDGLARCRAQSGPVPDAQDRDPRIWKAAEFMAGRCVPSRPPSSAKQARTLPVAMMLRDTELMLFACCLPCPS